ncbi:hypothetical protein ACFCYB_10625 [Streptomyces sp. NPDC056309]|uniref:hypothetical protein n=1 Tax=unclassified Streptomyces TaxID=2593676 RepID=UPI0035DAD4BB
MTSRRGALTALHLFLVWATMAVVAPALGFGLVVSAWGGGPVRRHRSSRWVYR